MIMKGLICQENIAILNMHTANNRAARYVKQKVVELKEQTDPQLQLQTATPLSQ